MLTIGDFSRLSRVTPRMLRHYDALGLLHPDTVGENGYRYYRQEQLSDLVRIQWLSGYGFALHEIGPLLGLEDAFVNGAADFSSMGDNPYGYYIDKVIHATKIEVNEKGTEAAAATVVAGNAGAAPPPQEGVTLVLDRPFLYGIVDLYTGVPLFLGTYE